MFKLLLLLALLYLFLRGRRHPRSAHVIEDGVRLEPIGAVREMEQDPVCRAFVAKSQALTTVSRGRVHYFCSGACYRQFLSAPPASAEKTA